MYKIHFFYSKHLSKIPKITFHVLMSLEPLVLLLGSGDSLGTIFGRMWGFEPATLRLQLDGLPLSNVFRILYYYTFKCKHS